MYSRCILWHAPCATWVLDYWKKARWEASRSPLAAQALWALDRRTVAMLRTAAYFLGKAFERVVWRLGLRMDLILHR